jgi:hypothetical protein
MTILQCLQKLDEFERKQVGREKMIRSIDRSGLPHMVQEVTTCPSVLISESRSQLDRTFEKLSEAFSPMVISQMMGRLKQEGQKLEVNPVWYPTFVMNRSSPEICSAWLAHALRLHLTAIAGMCMLILVSLLECGSRRSCS